jgi:hypothetical protein
MTKWAILGYGVHIQNVKNCSDRGQLINFVWKKSITDKVHALGQLANHNKEISMYVLMQNLFWTNHF